MRRMLVGVVLGSSLGWSGEAPAQTREDMARADALFSAGKALTDAGQYADACAKFAESKRLAPGLGVTLYLADCYERIGRTASAWTEFRSAEGQARERNDKRADVARARAQTLEQKLDRLTITVAPTVPRLGLEVLRDGMSVAQEELGLPVPVDPGDHVVVASRQGHGRRTFPVHVGPDQPAASVTIDSLDETATAAATPIVAPRVPETSSSPLPETPALPPASEDRGSSQRWIGMGVGAIGVVGVGVGAGFAFLAKSKRDQSNDGPCDKTDHCTSDGLSLRKDAGSAATIASIAFAGGGAALATGIVLYLTAPHRARITGLTLAPAVVAGGAGALLRGEF
jgi:hypothetical protein